VAFGELRRQRPRPHYVAIGDSEYIVGIGPGPGSADSIVVYENEAGVWNEVASADRDDIYGIDVAQSGGKIYIALIQSVTIIQTAKVASELNTSADSLTLMVRSPALSMTPDHRPVVLFRYSNSTYIYRRN
jgi:hypothetical protein